MFSLGSGTDTGAKCSLFERSILAEEVCIVGMVAKDDFGRFWGGVSRRVFDTQFGVNFVLHYKWVSLS